MINNLNFKLFLICIIIIPAFLTAGNQSFEATKTQETFEIKAGKSTMKISAGGGRIISYKCNEQEILTQALEHENYGSTFWTAPQSEWNWPPFDVLDNQEYHVEQEGNLLKMTSNPDPKSGFQMIKTWKVTGRQNIEIEYRIKNISVKPKSVGAWEVTRVPCGGLAFFPDGGTGKVPESNLKPDLRKEGINWISINKVPIQGYQKLFSTAKEGWLAYALNGLLFIKQFPDTKPENYSPRQGEVEIYINKDKIYIELENHGEYQLLQPGESLSYKEKWFLMSLPENVTVNPGNPKLTDFVRKQIISEK
jgi:hypothetical protein